MIPATPKPKKRIVYKQFDHGRLVSTPQSHSSPAQELLQTHEEINFPKDKASNQITPIIEEQPLESEADEYVQAIEDLQMQYPDSEIQQGVLKVNLQMPQHIKSTYNAQYSEHDKQEIRDYNSVHLNLKLIEKPQESSMEIQSTMKNDYRKPTAQYSLSLPKREEKRRYEPEYYYPMKSNYQYEYINWGHQKQEAIVRKDLPATLPGVKMNHESTYKNNYKEKEAVQREEVVKMSNNFSLGRLPFLGRQNLEYKVEFDKNKQKRFSESVLVSKSYAGQYVSESQKEYQRLPLIKQQKQLERTLVRIGGLKK